jgi:hypothetical protein
MSRRSLRAAVLCVFGLGVTVACTVNTTDDRDGGQTTTPTRDSGTSVREGGTSGDGGVKNCSSQTDQFACYDCCGDNSDAVLEADKAYDDCACAGPCSSACTAYCANRSTKPDDTCAQCIASTTTASQCEPKSDEVCRKDPACNAVTECIRASSCNDKPVPDAGF